MKRRLIHLVGTALALAALSAALVISTATASTGFEAEFKDSKHSTTLLASTSQIVFTLAQGALGCQVPFTATTNIPASVVIASSAADPGCDKGTLQMNGCKFTLAPEGTFGIGPPGCGPVILYTCSIQPQSGLGAVYTNNGSGKSRTVTVKLESNKVKHTCNGNSYEGTIEGSWTLQAKAPGAEMTEGLWVSNSISVPRFCKVAGETCSAGNLYPAETWLQGSSSEAVIAAKVGKNIGKMTCGASSFEALPMFGLGNWQLGSCKLPAGGICSPVPASGSYASVLSQTTGNDGALAVTQAGWNIECEGGISCEYRFSPTLDIKAGNPATLVASDEAMSQVGGEYCLGTEPKFSGTYTINSPKPLYLAKG